MWSWRSRQKDHDDVLEAWSTIEYEETPRRWLSSIYKRSQSQTKVLLRCRQALCQQEALRAMQAIPFLLFVYWKPCDDAGQLHPYNTKPCCKASSLHRPWKLCAHRRPASHMAMWLWIEEVLEGRSNRRSNRCLSFEHDYGLVATMWTLLPLGGG